MQHTQPQSALITGAGSGIGQAIAIALAAAGVRVWLCGRRQAALEETAALCAGQARCIAADVADDGAIATLVETVGPLDVLVHSAGRFARGTLADVPVQALDELYAVNVRGPYALTRALMAGLVARRGQVVFINSTVGLAARGTVGAYAASKFALRALADALRDEVGPAGVRVISVYPGRTATPMQEHVVALEGGTYDPARLIQPADVAAAVVTAVQLPRTAEVTDLTIRPSLGRGTRTADNPPGKAQQ